MIKINWLEYEIENVNYRVGHIQLQARDKEGNIINTYPIVFSTTPELEETKEETRTEKYIDKEIQQDEEGNDFIADVIKSREVVETIKTGNMIPNERYLYRPTLDELEEYAVKFEYFER